MLPDLMVTEEPEISSTLRNLLERDGVHVFTESTLKRVDHKNGKRRAVIAQDGDEEVVEFGLALVAAGRRPNTHDLNLESAGVESNEKGIVVDDELGTSADHVWACGDVTGRYPFTHVASHHADVVLDNILDDAHREVDEKSVPWVIFTDPELAHVGMTEGDAREAGFEIKTARVEAERLPRARTALETFGLGKMVVDAKTDRILGAGILCWNAGELIHEVGLAIREGITAKCLAGTIHSYPTMSQILPGLARRSSGTG
jgi:mercuric reductase